VVDAVAQTEGERGGSADWGGGESARRGSDFGRAPERVATRCVRVGWRRRVGGGGLLGFLMYSCWAFFCATSLFTCWAQALQRRTVLLRKHN
jgi:hypothetical protein